MYGYELRAHRKRFGLSQQAMGALILVGSHTISYWEQGKRPIPGPAQVALGYTFAALEDGNINVPGTRNLVASHRRKLTQPLRDWVMRWL